MTNDDSNESCGGQNLQTKTPLNDEREIAQELRELGVSIERITRNMADDLESGEGCSGHRISELVVEGRRLHKILQDIEH